MLQFRSQFRFLTGQNLSSSYGFTPRPLESFQKDPLKFFPKFNGSVKCFSISELEESKKGEAFSLDLYLSCAFDSLVQNLVMFDQDCKKIKGTVRGRLKKGRFWWVVIEFEVCENWRGTVE